MHFVQTDDVRSWLTRSENLVEYRQLVDWSQVGSVVVCSQFGLETPSGTA